MRARGKAPGHSHGAAPPVCGRASVHDDWTFGIPGGPWPGLIRQPLQGSDANPELCGLVAATIAAEQCRLLRAAPVEEFHFYTLNRAKLMPAICHILRERIRS
jgi:hypothetical protein